MQSKPLLAGAVLALALTGAVAGEVEVLHYWTSGGEAKSAAELRKIMQSKGHTWKDFAVAGGGGDNAMTVLKSRVVSGNPPRRPDQGAGHPGVGRRGRAGQPGQPWPRPNNGTTAAPWWPAS
jgi:hypothetical protein